MTAGTSATASSKCGLRVYGAEAWDLRSASGGGPSPGAPASLWDRGAYCLGLALQASSLQCRPAVVGLSRVQLTVPWGFHLREVQMGVATLVYSGVFKV